VPEDLIRSAIAFFAVVVSIVALVLNRRTARRQEALTRESAWRQEVGVAQWRRDLRDWASEAIDVLSEAIYACDDRPDASTSDFGKYLHRLWALIDRGRFFLPNQQPERREDPVPAFKGYRHRALDPLWAAGNVLEDRIDATLYDDVVRYRRYVLEELQREFVSNISSILNPEHHNQEIARLIRDSERQVKALRPEETPSGDKLLLRDVVRRVVKRQASRQG
jgi:hypothetical protein